ncbi:MAG: class I SAM-dependent methyltransferase [Clostridiales bacterium]|nr:class I SAM-dependent methyltransferase [Clostridiales bacterium]
MLSKTQAMNWKALRTERMPRMNARMRACACWSAIEEHDKILDMACGEGALLRHLSEGCRLTVCGMCESPEKARYAREVLDGADVVPGRMEDIPWRNDTFDVVMVPGDMRGEPRRIFDEVFRVLKTGGQITLATALWQTEGNTNRRELMRLMQEAGFRDVSYRAAGFSGAIVGWKKRKMPV